MTDIFTGGLTKVLVDETNLAADTYYYPSTEGMDFDEFDDLSIGFILSGGVTLTIEAIQDEEVEVSPTWIDITRAGFDITTASNGASNFIDSSKILDFDNLNVSKFRVKIVTSDNTNGVKIVVRIKSIDK